MEYLEYRTFRIYIVQVDLPNILSYWFGLTFESPMTGWNVVPGPISDSSDVAAPSLSIALGPAIIRGLR